MFVLLGAVEASYFPWTSLDIYLKEEEEYN
jgi:hypothetical protein